MLKPNLNRLKQIFLDMWEDPFLAAILAFTIYAFISLAMGPIWRDTGVNYFSYLADAFLHGQLHLRLVPPTVHDLVFYQNRFYLYWPPFPAVLFMPFVAVFGIQFSDVIVTLVVGALNVAIVALLLRKANEKNLIAIGKNYRALLVIFFALGSVQMPLAPFGDVWAVSQLITFFFLGLAYLAAISLEGWEAFLCTGAAMGCAILTRNNTLLLGVWPAYYLISKYWKYNWKKTLSYSSLGALVVILFGCMYLIYNYSRFGNPLEIGYQFHQMDELFVSDYQQYGAFNIHYLPTNIYYQYLYYPFPWRADSFMGGSLFLMSPILFGVFAGIKNGAPRISVVFLALSILLTNIPILLLMGTGWIQVGPRYTLDFTIPLILLLAMGIKKWKPWLVTSLVIVSCINYFAGTYMRLLYLLSLNA